MAESYLEGRIDTKEIFELDCRQLTFEQIMAEDIWIQDILRRSNVTKSPEASPDAQLQTRLEELRSQLESLRWKDAQREQICKAMCQEILKVTALCLQETAVGQEATGQFAFARQRLESIRKLAEQVVSKGELASLPAVDDVLKSVDVLAKAFAELKKKGQELDSRKQKFDETLQKEKEQRDKAKMKFAKNVRNLFHTGKYVYVKYTDSLMQKTLPKVFDALGKCATSVAPDDVLALFSVRGLCIVVTYGRFHIWSAASSKHVFVLSTIPENQLTLDKVKFLPFSTLRCQGEKVKMFCDFFPARKAAKEFCKALAALCNLNFIGGDYVSRLNDISLPTCFGDAPT
ncbi:MAG: hypothetical protein IJJ33_06445 [Victivallales bacterium]|nr:hypothetical protein [Victivallales bacterium]